jgi:phospholipase/carboxylesterase
MMSGFFELDGPRFGPAAGGVAEQLVILLHGLGADGQDLIGIAPHWAQVLPNAAFVAPNAPFPCDMAPHGYQWFSVQDRSPEAMLAGVRMAAGPLDAFIDRELDGAGLDESKAALVGFSQGTMMSLFVGPRRVRQLAGIVGFSGRLIAPELLREEIRSQPPVLLAHGTMDEVVPYESMALAEKGLADAGIVVEALSCPGIGHGIDQNGLIRGAEFLQEVLAP